MTQVEVMLHSKVHKTKPTEYEKLREINKLKLRKVTLNELAEHVSKGRIFFPSVHAGNGNVRSETFIRQQLCLVDIDNVDPKKTDAPPYPFTEDNIVALAKEFGLEVAIIYRTQSYTPELPKFRVGFVADRVFTEYKGLLKEAHYALFKIFNSVSTERLVDTSCNEASRLFNGALYGSKPYVNENAASFNAEALIELTKDLPKVPKAGGNPDTEKNDNTIIEGKSNNTTDSIEAIRAGNVHKFRTIFLENLQNDGADNEAHLSHFAYKALTDNAEDVIIELDLKDVHELFNRLPMTDLFSLPNTTFACVIHDDSRPSASISTYPDGNDMYKCFADGCMCHKAHSNFMLLEHFVGSKRKAFRFIHSLFDIEMKTELSKRVKQNKAFIESDTFKKVCPVTYDLISRSHFKRKLFETLKCVASVVMPVQLTKDGNDCSFFYSMSEIEKLMKSTIAGTSPDSICQTMSFAALLGLINKRADEDLTDDVYNKLQDQRLRTAERTEQEASDVRRLSVYSVPLISEMDLNQLEAIAIKAKNSGISVSKMNRNLVAQIFGEDVAKSVYPTEEATVISYKKLKNANVVEKAVQQCLKERGVVDRKTIKEKLKEFSMSNNEFNEAYTVALAKLGLQTVTAKNEHRELFGIDFPRNTRISFYPEGVEISNSTEEVIGVTNQKEESISPFMSMLIDEINRPVAEQEMKQLTYAEATKAVREELDDVAVMQERVRFEMAVEKLIFDEEINDLLNDIEEETHTEESIVEIPVEVEEVQIVDNVGFNCTLKTEYDRNSTARRNPIPLIRVLSMYYDFQVLPLSQKTLLRRSQHVFKVDNASKDYEYMDLKKSRKRAPAGRRMPYSRCKPNNNWKVYTLDKSIIACT